MPKSLRQRHLITFTETKPVLHPVFVWIGNRWTIFLILERTFFDRHPDLGEVSRCLRKKEILSDKKYLSVSVLVQLIDKMILTEKSQLRLLTWRYPNECGMSFQRTHNEVDFTNSTAVGSFFVVSFAYMR